MRSTDSKDAVEMDEEVLSPRETEIEVRFRSLETRTLETVERNGELLQVRIPHVIIFMLTYDRNYRI